MYDYNYRTGPGSLIFPFMAIFHEWPFFKALQTLPKGTWELLSPPLYRASQVVLVVKNLPANAGDIKDVDLIPGLGRSPGGGRGNSL